MRRSARHVDLTFLRWLYTDWKTLENGVSVAFGFGVEVLELRGEGGEGPNLYTCVREI